MIPPPHSNPSLRALIDFQTPPTPHLLLQQPLPIRIILQLISPASNPNDQKKSKKKDEEKDTEPPHPHFSKAIKTFALRASLPSLKEILLKPPACIPFHVPFASLPGGKYGFCFEHLCFNAKVQARDGRHGTTLPLSSL
jgi:hypothetical protein